MAKAMAKAAKSHTLGDGSRSSRHRVGRANERSPVWAAWMTARAMMAASIKAEPNAV